MTLSENVPIRRVRTTGCFEEAVVLTNFCRPWQPARKVPRTEFRGVHDGEFFAFRFDIEDADIVLAEAATEDNRVLGSDRAEIFFSTDESLSLYYGLEMDPRGNVHDYVGRFYREFDRDWRMPGLMVESEISGNGYSVEGRIPLSTLRELALLRSDNTVIAGIFRAEFSRLANGEIEQDWMPWIDPQTETPDFHVPSAFGRLVFEGL